MCTIHSHTDCSTFDGVLFRIMGTCTYVLAKTCSPAEALPVFSVEVVNEQKRNSSVPTVQQVTVDTGNFRVSLLKWKTHQVVVNGVWRKLPLSLGNDTIRIRSNPGAVALDTSFGLSVSFDSAGAVHVILPSRYSDKVCGICGNFNNLRGDDFYKPDGTVAQDATTLTESWRTGEASSCETISIPHQCDPLEEAEYASELYCGALLANTGPFAGCQSVVGAESYFRGCVVSMCSAHGDPAVLCEALQIYTDICYEAGADLPTWRNSTFCPFQCGENSYYNSCADGCPEVCSSQDLTSSCGSCVERCECDFGFKVSGGKCVPAEDCGCWHNGKHYEKGETFLEGQCVRRCQCTGNNDVQCTAKQCAASEVCKVKDGNIDCFPFKPATCRVYGDPHYITFDRAAYNFQGGCSYTLATTCGEESPVPFTVIGHNMHPRLQNFTRSKLQAVTLQVENLYLTLNQSGQVYVKHINEGGDIILKTSFGLRITLDGHNRLFLQVDEQYKYEMCGLCGTYSGYQDDDFVTPDGQNTTDPFEFGNSWRVPGMNDCVPNPNGPELCDHEQEEEAYGQCYALLGDPFRPCHELIHPSIYIGSCVYDYCATNGSRHTLCESLKSYAAACQFEGVELPPWQTGTACAVPTMSAPTSPTSAQAFCPMNCDFERNLCGWKQLVQDSFDWSRHSGPTPSHLTGPNQDHTTGAGFYMYIEGDSVTHGDSARLMSSVCHYNGPLCLHFWYHMYGSATAMALNIYLLKGNKATKLWSKTNNQGPEWHPGNVDIGVLGPFQIIVEAIRGFNALSDVAIDDVSIHFGSCSGENSVCNLDCSFGRNLCSWNQMLTDAFDWTWHRGPTLSLMTGPSSDHTGDGHYLYIEASGASFGDMARLISSECSDPGPQCLQFWYHMYGSADTMGLHVYLLQNRVVNAVWRKHNDQGNMWHLAQVDLTTTGVFQIIFEGRRGSTDQSDVAIDDISLHHGHCSELATPTSTATESVRATTEPLLTSTVPKAPKTTRPIITTTSVPQTARQEPKTTAQPELPTTDRPEPQTTAKPQLPTTTRPEPQTTAQPQLPTTTRPEPQTTAQPQPPTTTRPEPQTTAQPQPPTTTRPEPKTTAQPQPPTTTRPEPQTTAKPELPTTTRPEPQTTKSQHCVPLRECGCVDTNGTKHQPAHCMWTQKLCKCECKKDDGVGNIDCDDEDECDGNAICLQNDRGEYYCQSTGFNECTIKGDPEYKTFDKAKHDFEGEYSYVLVRTKNLPNNLPDIYIECSNRRTEEDEDGNHRSSEESHNRTVEDEDSSDDEDDSEENEEQHTLQELKIKVYNHTVEFKKNRRLLVTRTPASPTAGLKIKQHSSRIYLKTDFGLSVEFDGRSEAEIILPQKYKRKVQGLCGNFDGQKENDWVKPDGSMAEGVQEFGESWRV
uniref:Zonadhesin-like n=1 Tax=Echeneis naucrates TaxID=173247 RepID=A0A665TE42_ECHNA